jgi:hypothetical protein
VQAISLFVVSLILLLPINSAIFKFPSFFEQVICAPGILKVQAQIDYFLAPVNLLFNLAQY